MIYYLMEVLYQKKCEAEKKKASKDILPKKKLKFSDFHLKEEILLGIIELGYKAPSPIQEESIPAVLSGKDILARSKSGTGKTSAFLIPSLHMINSQNPYIQVTILVPTRELAFQTSYVCKKLGKYVSDLKVMVTTGGMSLQNDIVRMSQVIHILIGTPSRIFDLLEKGIADLSKCKILILDEADKLLSNELVKKIETMSNDYMPLDKQTILISATFPITVKHIKDTITRSPFEINLMEELVLKEILQYYAFTRESKKIDCITFLLKKIHKKQSIIFCNSSNRVELLSKKISQLGYCCYYIHAKMQQANRNRIFHEFKTNKYGILIASDLFTRGIDIISIELVINFDLPKSSETYLHRIGRCGRFGKGGIAISFVTEDDKLDLHKFEKELNTKLNPVSDLFE